MSNDIPRIYFTIILPFATVETFDGMFDTLRAAGFEPFDAMYEPSDSCAWGLAPDGTTQESILALFPPHEGAEATVKVIPWRADYVWRLEDCGVGQ